MTLVKLVLASALGACATQLVWEGSVGMRQPSTTGTAGAEEALHRAAARSALQQQYERIAAEVRVEEAAEELTLSRSDYILAQARFRLALKDCEALQTLNEPLRLECIDALPSWDKLPETLRDRRRCGGNATSTQANRHWPS